ncbi:MAG TPA: chemotaxis protein CheR [Lachnospiraceae bacterium]|nr:chemotaxis protein CheR [Lachnospiraceae bacterium]
MQLTDREFAWIVSYIHTNYGINLSQKRVLVTGRLQNYLLRNGYKSYGEYIARIEKNPKGQEAVNLINVLTTNHTYFMREPVHFEYMKNVALPWVKQCAASKRDVRVWSAAASTGEEPYVVAMLLMEFFKLDTNWDIQILATDLSTRVLKHAMEGKYLAEQIAPLPDRWKKSYFKRISEEEYQVKNELRKQVVFRQFNLMDDIKFKGLFHIVFLRNVMIYFDDNTKKALLERIYDHMENGGYIFIGTTESIDKTATQFKYVQPSVYRKIN